MIPASYNDDTLPVSGRDDGPARPCARSQGRGCARPASEGSHDESTSRLEGMTDDPLRYLDLGIDRLPISIGARNRLREAGILHIGDLVQKTDRELLYLRSFGKKSLVKITHELSRLGLKLSMIVDNWPEKKTN